MWVTASSSDGHATPAEQVRPLVDAGVDVLPRRVVGRGDPFGRPAEEHGERGGPHPRGRRRPFERLEQGQPVAGDRRAEHAAGAVDHGRHADGVEGVAHERAVAVGADEHGDVPGPHPFGAGLAPVAVAGDDLGRRGQQSDDVGGEILGDVLPPGRVRSPTPAG